MATKPSLKAVAELAGVGYATASRALSGKGYVAPETKEKVVEAAQTLNYVPNQLAKALREHRSALVGVIVPDLVYEYYSESTQVINQDLQDAGFQMLVAAANTPQAQEDAVASFTSLQVAGIIQVPMVGATAPRGVPVVQMNRGELGANVARVSCNDEDGFYQLTDIILSGGARTVVGLLGEESLSTTQERAKGITRAAALYGVDVEFHFGQYSVQSGEQMADDVVANGLPDALIVASPRLMAGVVQSFSKHHISVPEDVVVGGYDDPEWYSFIGSGITTFVPPHERMGKEAVRILLSMINGLDTIVHDMVLPGQVIVRGSSAHT